MCDEPVEEICGYENRSYTFAQSCKGGNSEILCRQFSRGGTEAGHLIETISLRDKELHCCTGCAVCMSSGKCVQKDDAAEILEKMLAADVIVLATPVYFYTMAVQLKMLIRSDSSFLSTDAEQRVLLYHDSPRPM